jgi:hypothetical protein
MARRAKSPAVTSRSTASRQSWCNVSVASSITSISVAEKA